jgi:indole-3-glycerol phosphate synthase
MINTVPDILARIVDHKALELKQAAAGRGVLERRAEERTTERRDFAASLKSKTVAVIAEIKKASPSKGLLCEDFNPPLIAAQYEAGGAAALSILTDSKFFQGSLRDLEEARAAVTLPALRKDFTIDEFQVIEAAAHGADAILLIAAILSPPQLQHFRELAARYKMAALVEVHDKEELAKAIDSGAEIIGVNNRNLRTFEVTLETSLNLAEKIPNAILKISESGFESREQIDRLHQAGFQAFLIGEHLMKTGNPREALRKLTA